MSLVGSVQVARRPVARLEQVIGGERQARLVAAAGRFRQRLAGRTVWNVSSTAVGGGVAEMLQVLVGYVEDFDIPIRWLVITGDAGFFVITKRLHNQIHGEAAGGPLSRADGSSLRADARRQRRRAARPGPAGRSRAAARPADRWADRRAGARRAPGWRGAATSAWTGRTTPPGRRGASCGRTWPPRDGFVFSRRQYVPAWVPGEQGWIIPPSIDPFSAKNQQLDDGTVLAILARIGMLDGTAADRADLVRPSRRRAGRRHPARGDHRRWPARARRSGRGPGLPVGPAQGHARGDARLRRACRARRAVDTWCWSARRSPG